MKIPFATTKYTTVYSDGGPSLGGMPKEHIQTHIEDRLNSGITLKEYALIQYRCAALTGFLSNPNSDFIKFNEMASDANGQAQAMLALDEEETE